jgi:hypothetical protein
MFALENNRKLRRKYIIKNDKKWFWSKKPRIIY